MAGSITIARANATRRAMPPDNSDGIMSAAPPQTDSFGDISGGSLELSNVEPVRELIELIKTQRGFELNSQSIQSADESLQVVTNLRRF